MTDTAGGHLISIQQIFLPVYQKDRLVFFSYKKNWYYPCIGHPEFDAVGKLLTLPARRCAARLSECGGWGAAGAARSTPTTTLTMRSAEGAEESSKERI